MFVWKLGKLSCPAGILSRKTTNIWWRVSSELRCWSLYLPDKSESQFESTNSGLSRKAATI